VSKNKLRFGREQIYAGGTNFIYDRVFDEQGRLITYRIVEMVQTKWSRGLSTDHARRSDFRRRDSRDGRIVNQYER